MSCCFARPLITCLLYVFSSQSCFCSYAAAFLRSILYKERDVEVASGSGEPGKRSLMLFRSLLENRLPIEVMDLWWHLRLERLCWTTKHLELHRSLIVDKNPQLTTCQLGRDLNWTCSRSAHRSLSEAIRINLSSLIDSLTFDSALWLLCCQ